MGVVLRRLVRLPRCIRQLAQHAVDHPGLAVFVFGSFLAADGVAHDDGAGVAEWFGRELPERALGERAAAPDVVFVQDQR